jgi:hypothetical protein
MMFETRVIQFPCQVNRGVALEIKKPDDLPTFPLDMENERFNSIS